MESLPTIRTHVTLRRAARAFTLVEMVVVISIILVITAVVISGQSSYNQTLVLTDTAYTVALSVRQAQSLGLASRGIAVGGSPISSAGYGVHFAGAASYTVFADTGGPVNLSSAWCPRGTAGTPEAKPGNCQYDAGTDQIVQTYTFSRGFTISNICGKVSSGSSCITVPGLDAVFTRPETQAVLTSSAGQSFVCAQVTILSPTGGITRVVRISQLGEVSVGQTCP